MTNVIEKGRVFVVQRPARFDRKAGTWVDKFDISAAQEYGALTYLLNPGNIKAPQMEATVVFLKEELQDFSDADYLLALGDPVALALAAILASNANNGKVSILKYDRLRDDYYPFKIQV